MKQTLSTAMFLLLIAGGARADVIDVYADSYTHNDDTSNFGAEPVVRAKFDAQQNDHMRITYVKFDLSGVTGDITQALLQLSLNEYTETGGPYFRRVHFLSDDSWSASALTWNNKPASEPEILGLFSTGYGWREINIATPGKQLEVVARKGYYAPSEDADPSGGSF